MRKITSTSLVIMFLIGLLCVIPACNGDDDSKTKEPQPTGSGQLPVLHVGDTWEYRVNDRMTQYNLVYTVTAVDEYYSMSMKMDPPLMGGISEATAQFDKDLLLPVVMEMSGIDPQTNMEFDVRTEASYELSGDRWPLEVGKEIQVTENTKTIMNIGGQDMTDNTSETATYKVDGLENIVVEDGIYNCYRIYKFSKPNILESTSWHSDIVKASVREINHSTGEIQELLEFSVQ